MRLFFAILFPETVKDGLCAAMEKMRPCFPGGNFTRRENLHLTLAFLGEAGPAQAESAREALRAVRAAPFRLQIGGIGCFRRGGGDIYWAGVEKSRPLAALHDALNAQLRARGLRTEDQPFRPHLTLVRRAVLAPGCDRGVFDVPVTRMRAEKVSLMESRREEGRLVYLEKDFQELKEGEGKG